jgi:two-component system sensor histidine kinase AlgZ
VHPLLASRARAALYLGLWIGMGALLAALLLEVSPRPASHVLAFVAPLVVVYAFVCLSALWICRSHPVGGARPLRRAAVLAGSALQSAAAWTLLAAGWAALLHSRGVGPAWEERSPDLAIVFVAGVVLYAQSIVAHYLVLAFEASRAAERRLLESQVAAREAELKALRAQLHPHFLFNALNSISALVGHDPEGARRMTELLGDFLRTSLALGARARVPLHEELALAERYLAVEQVRFGAKLAVTRAIEDGSARCAVPPLLVQPLVENAVKHGVAGRLGGGTVHLAARRRGERLEIAVENPFDEDAPPGVGAGMGLDNVRRRLATLSPGGASLEVAREAGTFRVTLRLPVLEDADGG